MPLCMELFSMCQSGVNELNQKLQLTALDAYKAVSIVSAYKPLATRPGEFQKSRSWLKTKTGATRVGRVAIFCNESRLYHK
uniref:Uncharacterized protein n=1 Tax=Hyaloperonospora arabidopsidis (strain Emoy2) TaxID=559515 RepID=M4C1E7_HYAAE